MDVFAFLEKRQVNLEEVFNTTTPIKKKSSDIESLMRKLGHNMEKKVSLWWDITTFEQYLKDNITPRRLRWDITPNDGILDQESVDDWFKFFNTKGLELLAFLLERKRSKLKTIEAVIAEVKEELDAHKDKAEFITLTTQLNKDLTKKDKEVQQRKSKKYSRDLNDFKTDHVFKWQSQLDLADPISTYSTPEKTVRMHPQHNNSENNYRPQEQYDRNRRETPRQGYEERQGNYYHHNQYTPHRSDNRPQQQERTPQNGWKKPFWKNNYKKNNGQNQWHKNHQEQRDNRPYQYNQRDNRGPPDNRHRPQEGYGPRTRTPERQYDRRDGENRGPPYHPPPPPQGTYRQNERSPINTHNYYAPLNHRADEERSDRHRHSDTDYERSFLERGRENYPTRHTEESRQSRRTPERREDAEGAREPKRKRT